MENTVQEKPIVTKKTVTIDAACEQVAVILSQHPTSLEFGHKNEGGKTIYGWLHNGTEATKSRGAIEKVLRNCYEQNAVSYGALAAKLRVEGRSVMALLDEQFQEENGL